MSDSRRKPLESAEVLRHSKDKKPRRTRTVVVLILSAALGFALFFLIGSNQAKNDGEASISHVLIARDKALLHSITVQMAGVTPYTLINVNDYDLSDTNDVIGKEYEVDGDGNFAVSTAKVLSMERFASDMSADDVATGTSDDLDQYGLKTPEMTVVFGYRDNTKETLYFGGSVPTGNGYYLKREGDPAVYVIESSVYEAFHRPLKALAMTESEKKELADEVATQASAQPGATLKPQASSTQPAATSAP